jgi:hypothetical protein
MEVVIEVVGEVLFEFGFHSTAERLSSGVKNKFIVGTAYTIFGGILGGLSLLIFPKLVFANPLIPITYFVIAPIIGGLSLSFVSWIINKGIRPARLFEFNKFIYGVLFALSYAIARVIFG